MTEPTTNVAVLGSPAGDAEPPQPPPPARARRRDRWFRYTLPGMWGALLFACSSFTPSLLPRSGVVQGAVCGITAAIGYGLGVVAAWVWRAFADRDARPARRLSWQVFSVVAVLAVVTSYLLGRSWQDQIRALMGVKPDTVVSQLLLPVVTALLFVGLVALGRVLRKLYRWLAHLLRRWIGPKAATMVGWVAVVALTYWVVSGLLLQNLADLANESFSVANGITKEGVVQPTSPTLSGSPQSLVGWDTLGREGRTFVAGAPSATDISTFTGQPAKDPIRIFAGLESADSTADRAELAVQDLERAGGFDREYLLVVATTGSGWVSPGSSTALEYLAGGDSAIVGIQYSYLPSWISYLVDQEKARDAGRALFDAVYAHWMTLPENARPKLLVFGESLGSFGGEAAFSGAYDMANRTSGILFTGPPNFNVLYREFTDDREPGTTEIAPVYENGKIVRFDSTPDGATPPQDAPWPGTRVVYVLHPSDPIVFWSPHLMLREPDWLKEPRGYDVLPASRWVPFVTFWQVTADLPMAAAVPSGHGHNYDSDYVGNWVKILQPVGWTDAKTAQLQQIVTSIRH